MAQGICDGCQDESSQLVDASLSGMYGGEQIFLCNACQELLRGGRFESDGYQVVDVDFGEGINVPVLIGVEIVRSNRL